MDELAALAALNTDAKPKAEKGARVQSDDLFSDVMDIALDMNAIARRMIALNRRRQSIIAKLDDPANADDPLRGKAESLVYRLKLERDDLLAEFEKKAKRADKLTNGIDPEQFRDIVQDIAYASYRSSITRVLERSKAARSPFWLSVLAAGAALSDDNAPPF